MVACVHLNLFLNACMYLEHSSRESHVADVTMTGIDVIHHEERLLGQKEVKYLLTDFISSTFTICVIAGSAAGLLAGLLAGLPAPTYLILQVLL